MSNIFPVITIDGFSATGKTTLAASLSRHLGWPILLSGMLYRYAAYALLQSPDGHQVAGGVSSKLVQELTGLQFVRSAAGEVMVVHEGEDLAALLRAEAVSQKASVLAKDTRFREQLLGVQRAYSSQQGLIAEGRDMASVVFPDAQLQIYLIADETVRANRRCNQLQNDGFCAKIQAVSQNIVKRDKNDEARTIASRRDNDQSLVIDTSALSEEEVFAMVVGDPRMSAVQGIT